jgi:hypothetical protein
MNPGWNTIEIQEKMTYDEAWEEAVDVLARKFDLEVLSKESGYIRTGWLHTWTGKVDESYKVRGIVKFDEKERLVEIKSEAQYFKSGFLGIGDGWRMGTDERLTTTLRTDLMGKIGRTAR